MQYFSIIIPHSCDINILCLDMQVNLSTQKQLHISLYGTHFRKVWHGCDSYHEKYQVVIYNLTFVRIMTYMWEGTWAPHQMNKKLWRIIYLEYNIENERPIISMHKITCEEFQYEELLTFQARAQIRAMMTR